MDLPDEAYLAALSTLPRMGPSKLAEALAGATPAEAWARRGPAGVDAEQVWAGHLDAGITILTSASPAWPPCLLDDPDPPALLFCLGDPAALTCRRAAIVGTRRASAYGRGLARRFGDALARAGVAVVSGLALGIDGEAHRGALDAGAAPPIGVVATGLDRPYPPSHRRLWEEVAERGLLVSEYPLGAHVEKWRFPARNRIIAALGELTVVVESRERGGSLYTAEFALDRGRTVLAVPGPIDSPVARGTNRLLTDGAHPLCDDQDLFIALGLTCPDLGPGTPPEPEGAPGRVLDAVSTGPLTLEELCARTGLPLPELALAVDRLCREGWLAEADGTYERSTPIRVRSGARTSGHPRPASLRA